MDETKSTSSTIKVMSMGNWVLRVNCPLSLPSGIPLGGSPVTFPREPTHSEWRMGRAAGVYMDRRPSLAGGACVRRVVP